jgi:3'(2'), 5'-bisphosphate nucleotidase
MGSSLKICLVAAGDADLYPRLGPTSEWDTAAAQAVLIAAGGSMMDLSGQPLAYNARESLLNPHFLALGDDIRERLTSLQNG